MMTSERAPTVSPEQTPQRTPEELLGVDSIEQYRRAQADALWDRTDLLKGAESRRAEREDFMLRELPLMHRNYLAQAGIDENDPRYPQYVQMLNQSAIETSNPMGDQWSIRDDNGQTKRDRYMQQYDQLFTPLNVAGTASPEAAPVAAATVEQDPILAEWHTELDTLRNTLAELTAKRHGRLAGKGGEEYEAARQRYNDQLITLGKLENEAVINDPNLNEQDKKIRVTEYLFAEQKRLHDATTDKLKNTKVGKFIEFMSRGKPATRIAKGLGLGLGVGIAGALIGAAAGVAGVAALGAGVSAAAAGATRYARGYAAYYGKEGNGMRHATDDQRQEAVSKAGDDTDQYIETINRHKEDLTEQEVKRGQRSTRMATALGATALIVGAGVASVAHAALEGGIAEGQGGELPANEQPPAPSPSHGEQATENPGAQNEASKAEAEAQARNNVIHGSDTPGMADAIRDALGGGAATNTGGVFAGEFGATALTPSGLENFGKWIEGYTVKTSDSVWSLSEQYLRHQGVANPSVYQIDAAKDAMLSKLQERGLVDTNGWLSAGQRISLR